MARNGGKGRRRILADETNELYFSPISIAEVAVKRQKNVALMPLSPDDVRFGATEMNRREFICLGGSFGLFAGCKLGDVSAAQRPGWIHAVETAVVEVYGNLGCRWFPI